MDEDQKTDQTVTSPETEVEVSTEVVENVEESEVDTQPTSEADVTKEESGEEQVDTPESKWENEKKSMAGKISKLEKDNNEYLQAKTMLDALNSAAANDPEFMKLANRKLVEQGVLDESAIQDLDTSESTRDEVADPAVKWAREKMQEEQNKRIEFFKGFEERHPDLQEGEEKIIRANRSAIGAAAAKRMAEAGASEEEAYEFAYKLIMNPTQLIEEGKLEGIAQAQSASPVEGAASGGAAKSSGGVELTPEQKDAARRFGISEEKYATNLGE